MSSPPPEPRTAWGRFATAFEENFIALLLGAMTVITVVNIFFRFTFNLGLVNWLEVTLGFTWPDRLEWGYQTTLILFSWLVLFGMAYAVKLTAHLGVDAIINMLSRPWRKVLGVVASGLCLLYAYLLLKGSYDYLANFINLPSTTGRFWPTGFEEMSFRNRRAFYTFDDIRVPHSVGVWLAAPFDEETFEKLPRFVAYAILPVASLMLFVRYAIKMREIVQGKADRVIAAHEAEEELGTLNEGRR